MLVLFQWNVCYINRKINRFYVIHNIHKYNKNIIYTKYVIYIVDINNSLPIQILAVPWKQILLKWLFLTVLHVSHSTKLDFKRYNNFIKTRKNHFELCFTGLQYVKWLCMKVAEILFVIYSDDFRCWLDQYYFRDVS